MKRNISILTVLGVASAITLSSCADLADQASEITPSPQLSITASVREASRAVFSFDEFKNQDRIGLYIIPGEGSTITEVQSTAATYVNGEWKLDRNFDLADFTTLQVMAYYPYEGVEANYLVSEQSIEYKAINLASSQKDLLTSTLTTVDHSNGVASLEFGHTLTCLSLNIRKAISYEGYGFLNNAYIEGGFNSGTLFSNGQYTWVREDTQKGEVKVMDSNVRLSDDFYKCQVLVFPMDQKSVYRLVLNVDDKDYLYRLPVGKPYAGFLTEFYINVDTPIKNTPDEIYFNGHKGIYLGINSNGQPLYWAQENVGASSAQDPGTYFCWGETKPYQTAQNTSSRSSSWIGSISGTSQDAAFTIMGEPWRTPTVEEYDDFLYSCSASQEEIDGVSGWRFTGPNSKSIFIPNGGCYFGERLYSYGEAGYLWSATASGEYSAYALNLSWASPMMLPSWEKKQGCNIRGVLSL